VENERWSPSVLFSLRVFRILIFIVEYKSSKRAMGKSALHCNDEGLVHGDQRMTTQSCL
jgi:hypothetical protein